MRDIKLKPVIDFSFFHMNELAINWVITVASAQPTIPKVGINKISRIILPKAPSAAKAIKFFCCLWAKIALLIIAEGKIIKTVKSRI